MKAIITVGISASGKTTWARAFQDEMETVGVHYSIVCRDDFRFHILDEKGLILDYSKDGVPWKNWNWSWEDEVTIRYYQYIDRYAAKGFNVILADTNLNAKRTEELREYLSKLGYDVSMKYFDIDLDEAILRDKNRDNGVGEEVITKQYDVFNKIYTKGKKWIYML